MKTLKSALLVALLICAFAVSAVYAESVTIKNPLEVNSLQDIFKFLSGQLMLLIIPIAVALYVYAGILYLYAAYEGKETSVTKAKNVLWYTTIGLVIIFIGGGFVDLIRSVLDSAGSTGGQVQQLPAARPIDGQVPAQLPAARPIDGQVQP
jgi:hypothetical protein